MITAAEAISCRSRRDTRGCEGAEHDVWICQLWGNGESLSESYGQLFRRLLHILETSYRGDVLVGHQNWIRLWLHRCLERAHREGMCEVNGCPWIAHICDRIRGSDYEECPLLVKGEVNVAGLSSAILSSRRASCSKANLDQTPDPAASPNDARPRDPDATVIEPRATPGSTGDNGASSSQPMVSGDADGAPPSIHSPGTAADTPVTSQAPLSTTCHLSPVADIASHVLTAYHASSIAVCASPPPSSSPAAGGVGCSDSHVVENPPRDTGESRVEGWDASWGDVADPRPGADAVLSAANALQM